MKTLILLRHAKSSWDHTELADHDRPLGPRGERASLVMGRYIVQSNLLPDLILCSSAQRAVDTCGLILSQWPHTPAIEYERELYLSGERAIRRRIGAVDGAVDKLLVIGHNPDLQNLTVALAAGMNAPLKREAQEHFPTGSLAVLRFPIHDWQRVLSTQGTLCELTAPRSLV